MDKNKDTFFQDLKRLLYNCKLSALKEMWPEVGCVAGGVGVWPQVWGCGRRCGCVASGVGVWPEMWVWPELE